MSEADKVKAADARMEIEIILTAGVDEIRG